MSNPTGDLERAAGSLLRRARRNTVLRAGARALRPARRATRLRHDEQLILRTGVFDVAWYEAQCGETFTGPHSAVRHYLRWSRVRGYSPNPFFEAEVLDERWTTKPSDPLLDYLADRRRQSITSPHPYLDLRRLRDQLAESGASSPADEGLGLWHAWVRQATPDTVVPTIEGLPQATYGQARETLIQAARDWRAFSQVAARGRVEEFTPDPVSRPHTTRPSEPGRPRVSVVIATWNRSHSVREAIASAQAQTLGDLEVIVVDDGSDDDTGAVLAGITHFDDRVRYVRRERGGVCRARNAGLAEARGDYVAFLDSDNTWRPEFLSSMVDAMNRGQWDLAHAALQMVRDDKITYRAVEGSRASLLLGNYIDLNVLLVRRDLLNRIGGFDESLRRAVDYDLILRLALHADLHLVKVIGADYSDDTGDQSRISNSEPFTWNQVVQNRHLLDWEELAQRPRVPGRISVVVPVAAKLSSLGAWVRLTHAPQKSARHDRLDVEVVLAGMRTRAQYCALSVCGRGLPVTLVLRNPRDRVPLLTNLGIAVSTGEVVVLCRPHAELRQQDLRPLVAALADPGVAVAHPLVERKNMTVASAGGVFGPGTLHPHPLLAGFPVTDALPLDGSELPAALSPVVALRAPDLIALGGLDPLLGNSLAETDLSLRAREAGLGVTRLVTASRPVSRPDRRYGFVEDMAQSVRVMAERWRRVPDGSAALWARAGFDHVAYRPVELTGTAHRSEKTWGLRPEPRRTRVQVREGVPVLRWTIDIAAPAGLAGEQWGDRHFSAALARALERRGQQVAVDHREARNRATRTHDDVLLVLRGLDEVFPAPGPVNLLWVISHPELVTAWEAARYDSVFAASTSWAEQTGSRWGLPVTPLLQCTDPELFHPSAGVADTGPELLFVGNARKVFRPIVRHALATGAELAVYGRGWAPFIDAHLVAGLHVPNHELGALYGSAGLVLNDHWDDMRRMGFLSNRLFDAVACGARVVSDDAPGIADTFGSSVAVVRSAADLEQLVRAPYPTEFPDYDARVERARRVHAEHSFDARAEQLLAEVLRLRTARADDDLSRRDPSTTVRRW